MRREYMFSEGGDPPSPRTSTSEESDTLGGEHVLISHEDVADQAGGGNHPGLLEAEERLRGEKPGA